KRDSEALENQALVFKLQLYGGMFGVFAALCMGVFFYLASRKNAARDTFRKCLFLAPPPIQNKFMELFDGFVAGLSNAKDRKGFWQAAALSIWMWCNGSLAIYCLFQAFSMSLPFGAACFVSVAIALTVALPQAPGFIGVFHVAMEKTMLLWGQEAASAQGFALIFWGVSFIPVTVIGLFALWSEGIALSDLRISKAVMPEDGQKNEHSPNH
ncbi:MAG: lysylphosphatidylglycerol synthase transmembrane domain-containing protein, partial [Myxococcota bacterium]|nr:lysylphosphatidylglycerol synthase transmembrane domain-containing protein [Myxococcota bacterium]